jgi:glyceraldehyde 3-phosphate dehydrogenase
MTLNGGQETIRIGINGFGRIGRAITRIASGFPEVQVVAINDLTALDNLTYLYNYDSTYGRADPQAHADGSSALVIGDAKAVFSAEREIQAVHWEESDVDVLIDATGVHENVVGANVVVDDGRVPKVIVTHSPPSHVDHHVILGVNEETLDNSRHHVVSSTICDANAIAHVLKALDEEYGVVTGLVTTLHPWLSYQNLVDGPVGFQRFPGDYWNEYALGRASIMTMIAKNTTAVTALKPVLPELEEKITGISFRTPTNIVSIADLSIQVGSEVTSEGIAKFLCDKFEDSPYVHMNHEPLVGVDFAGQPYSAVVDVNWIRVAGGSLVKLVLWYDNEWGYSSRVIDLARLMHQPR